MIVVDAGVLATALADDGPDGDRARARLAGEALAAPHLIDLEVISVLHRLALHGGLAPRRAQLALADLVDLPIDRVPHVPLLPRCWQLRDNVTAYSAAYVAVAERLGVVLVTADVRLARAVGPQCSFDVLLSPPH